jgi:hypothetical protein
VQVAACPLCKEAASRRGSIPPDWDQSQKPTFSMYGRKEFAPNRIKVFRDGEHRDIREIVEEVLALLARDA